VERRNDKWRLGKHRGSRKRGENAKETVSYGDGHGSEDMSTIKSEKETYMRLDRALALIKELGAESVDGYRTVECAV